MVGCHLGFSPFKTDSQNIEFLNVSGFLMVGFQIHTFTPLTPTVFSLLNSGDLKSWLVLISNGQKEFGLQMVHILNGIWNPEALPFEIRTKDHHFVKNLLKSRQKCPDFERSGFQMDSAIAKGIAQASENQIIWNWIFKTSGFQMCRDFEWSDVKSPMCVQDKQKSEFLSI